MSTASVQITTRDTKDTKVRLRLISFVSIVSSVSIVVIQLVEPTFLLAAAAPFAAEQTWTGQISDSACGAKHEEAAEGAGKMPDPECTKACIRGGSKYVLVVGGKQVFQIANQENKDLVNYAGQTVKVTGEMKGNAITVSKIESGS
jgi:acyl CoA:acetate/3-ketoacid CoA transferase beta subunit